MSIPVSPKAARLTRREAVEYLRSEWGMRRTIGTLGNLAVKGGGPEFQKDGHRTLYTPDALDAWAAKHLSQPVKSTAEFRELAGAA